MSSGKQSKLRLGRISFNAPVTLGFTLVSFIILILTMVVGDKVIAFFGIHYTSWLDPFMYLRLITHIFTHADLAHFTGNFMLILITGPMIEEKYGSKRLAIMIAVTAVITGLISIIFMRNTILLGASGIAFMLILLSSFVNIREGELPLTVILVAVFYIGNEIVSGVTQNDQISQVAHIVGGICGAVFGFVFYKNIFRKKSNY